MSDATKHDVPFSELLRETLDHLAHLLPAQGPIGVFIHHNTLHAFQDQPFEQAVVEASQIFGTEPYMSEAAYRRDLGRGRILPEDIDFVMDREPNSPVLENRLDRTALRRAILKRGLTQVNAESVEWAIEEGGLLARFRRDLTFEERQRLLEGETGSEEAAVHRLFEVCRSLVGPTRPAPAAKPQRPRDGFLAACGVDLDDVIHPLLVRLCAVFLDQGQAYWPMPRRGSGLLSAVRRLLGSGGVYPEYLVGLDKELQRQERASTSAAQVIEETLCIFGVPAEELETVLRAELLALPGWAGLIRRLEEEPDLAAHERVPATLADYLAVRLTLNKVAAANLIRRFHLLPASAAWRVSGAARNVAAAEGLAAALRLMDVAQLMGLTATELSSLGDRPAARLILEIDAFDHLERRRLYHAAYERRHEQLILPPLIQHGRRESRQPVRPSAQVFFCIDEREESTRRHLEEIDPEVETLAVAGFYAVAVNYTGIDDPHGAPLCPVVVKPKHAVFERSDPQHAHLHEMRIARRKLWSQAAWGGFLSSRTLVRGWLSAAVLGLVSLFPLTVRVLAPLRYARLRKLLNRSFLPVPRTELVFMRDDEQGQAAVHGLQLGFSMTEKIDRVAAVLGPAGLRDRFARIVVVLGHGSTSLNNPHESAYDCGACGGRRGGPNGRLFAAMANLPGVRAGLAERGIRIPDDTWFVGGYHDTCNDDIDLYDLDVIPESHKQDFARIRASLDKARAWDAHERSRRFEAAETSYTPDQALRHVEERSEHLAEPRPEYGHCTNAVTIVSKRSLTRGLFLDRRAFMSSYDSALDPEDLDLTGMLSTVIPVCAGISLEYYFSFVDNEGYGCGTKLPHNVTGLVGVMNGHAGDLRTGLSRQMVEIHEPVRNLFIVETTPERLMRAILRHPLCTEFLRNRWIRMASIDPETCEVHVYRDGEWERFEEGEVKLPSVKRSVEWYRGKMEHLPIARVEHGLDLSTWPVETVAS